MMNTLPKIITRFLLGLYVLAVFKPFFPYLEYAINKQLISQQFCENRARPELACEGRCYLTKRLAKTEAPEPASPSQAPVKRQMEQDSFHLRQSEAILSDLSVLFRLENIAVLAPFAQFAPDIFHPPRFASSGFKFIA